MASYVRSRVALRRRATRFKAGATGGSAEPRRFENSRSFQSRSLSATSALLGEVERGAARNESEASKIRRELLRAGFFGERSVFWYQIVRAFLFFAGALLGYIAHVHFLPDAGFNSRLIAIAIFAGLGFLLPSRFVAIRKKRLVQECWEDFPDFIDLMIVCAEAGLGPRAAIDRLSREIATTRRILGAHLYLSSLEIRAGSSLHQALFNLSRRTKVEEAATLAILLEQTEKLGTSVTDALRVYRDEMRDRRVNAAEEKAHALPAKLVLPLGLFVFPVILIVIMLPAVLRLGSAGLQ
jgi:tight adherence protein C